MFVNCMATPRAAALDEDVQVRAAAISALNEYFQDTSLSMPLLVPPSTPATRRVLEGDLLELILTAAGDPNVAVRSAAIHILGNSQDPRATQAIVAGMKDADWTVCSSAAVAAGNQPVDAVAEPLMKLLDDERISSYACGSLGQLKFELAIPKLKELVAKKRGTAVFAIGTLQEMGVMSENYTRSEDVLASLMEQATFQT
jgi:HEAT repeat protein